MSRLGGRVKSLLLFLTAFSIFIVILPILLVLAGMFLDGILGLTGLMDQYYAQRLILAVAFFIVGGYLAVASNIYLWRVGRGYAWGDISPSEETENLVTSGPYKYCRNPMLLGYFLLLSAAGLLVGSLSSALLIPLTVLILEALWIKMVEEPKLEERFGDAYIEYKRRVPFLIPRPWRRRRNG